MVENLMMTVMEITLSVSVVICLMLLLMPLFAKRYTAKWRYWIWLILAIRLLVPFNLTMPEPMITFDPPSNSIITERPMASNTVKNPEINYENMKDIKYTNINESVKKVNLNNMFSSIWLLGIFIFCAYHFISYLYFKKTIKRWGYSIKNMDIIHIFEEMKVELQITQDIEIRRCKKVSSPMMTGFIRPILLMPREDYSKGELFVILKHELIHYKRCDIWYKFILLLANAVHWFNPLVYIMVQHSNKDMEISCDSEVVGNKNMEFRKEYSQTILDLIHKDHMRQISLSTYFNGGKRTMKDRLIGILDMEKKKKGVVLFLFIAILVIISGTFIACNKVDNKIDNKISNLDKTIRVESADEAALIFSGSLIQEVIKEYKEEFGIDIVDQEITSIKQIREYNDLTDDGTIYVYSLQYKLKPKDQEKALLMGSMDMDSGWMTKKNQDDLPIILEQNGEYSFVSNMINHNTPADIMGDIKYDTFFEVLLSNNNIKTIAVLPSPNNNDMLVDLMSSISNVSEKGGTSIDRYKSRVYDFKYLMEEDKIEFMGELITNGKMISENPLKFVYNYNPNSGVYLEKHDEIMWNSKYYYGFYNANTNMTGTMDLTEYDREVEKLSDKFPINAVPLLDRESGILYRIISN